MFDLMKVMAFSSESNAKTVNSKIQIRMKFKPTSIVSSFLLFLISLLTLCNCPILLCKIWQLCSVRFILLLSNSGWCDCSNSWNQDSFSSWFSALYTFFQCVIICFIVIILNIVLYLQELLVFLVLFAILFDPCLKMVLGGK